MRQIGVLLACAVVCCAADVAGKWNLTATAPSGQEYTGELSLREEGGKLSGELAVGGRPIPLTDAQLNGDELSFRFIAGANDITVKMKLADGALKGTYKSAGGDSGPVRASRPAPAAGLAGVWKLVAKPAQGADMQVELDLKEDGGKLSGVISSAIGSAAIEDVKLEADQLSFRAGGYELKFTVAGNSLRGTYREPNGATGTIAGSK